MNMLDLFPVGQKITLGTRAFPAHDIIAFAQRFDPQPFHLDAEAAKNYVFGALCASGWHSASGWMRTFLDFWTERCTAIRAEGGTPPLLGPSPGFRDLAWIKPVFAGDELTYFLTGLEARPLNSRPGWRMNMCLAEAENQHGEPVLRFTSSVLEQEPAT
ncbi:MaoC family dehydratase [Allorhizobium undicola]|uniref:MaoC family dehydratase n=1 Tax=Allorhizobium undicola TaxID=78527 RepID=UPI0004817E0A|nr:MaoC family dehydratase [Allorhizobium undicola]